MKAAGGLIVDDYLVPCAVPVWNWEDHGMTFAVGRGARRRHPKTKVDLGVLHWTGGEGSVRTMFRTLTKRALGVEFAIERDGAVFQFADPATVDTFDAGYVNSRSWGVEIINYGHRSSRGKIPRKGRDRPTYSETINGKRRTLARFTPPQIASAIALTDALCTAFDMPKRVPRHGRGLMRRTMTRKEMGAFSGVVGHFHISRRKTDPGTDVLRALIAAGW